MKKLFLFVVSCSLFVVNCSSVLAQENKPATPAGQTVKSKVDEIKEKIASTVAQLNLVSKKVFVGQISKLEKTQITIEKRNADEGEETKIIDIDELTKYTTVGKGKRVEAKFSDLHLGDTIVAIGIYNKDSRKLLGRIILIKQVPVNINGVVREVDIQGGTIKVEDKKQNKIYTVDIEKTTIIRIYSKSEGLVKSGLSKIEIGERAHINGIADEKEESHIAANRILLLPGKAIGITTATPIKSATPSATPVVTQKPTKNLTATPTQTP